MFSLLRKTVTAALCASLALAPAPRAAQAAELGARVVNTASVAWADGHAGRRSIVTNEAVFRIEAERTPSDIAFFRHAPTLPGASPVRLNGTARAPSGAVDGPFVPMDPPTNPGGGALDLSAPLPMAEAETYLSGETVFVRVTDAGQNGDPARIETVVVTLTTDAGDRITLRLTEDAPDAGTFWGWVPSSREATAPDDATLTTGREAILSARYEDPFDATEVSVDSALVDPFGRVFDATTGALLDGLRVTVVDDATGAPAPVFGVDGVSAYPSTVVTGSTVTDASGLAYALEPGEFRFPLMAPGTYRVVVEPPAGYSRSAREGGFGTLPNAPFTITPASYGRAFALDGTGPVSFDVPLDPETDLVLTKAAEPEVAGVGDYVRYAVSISNAGERTAPVTLRDRAPSRFRYVKGSARLRVGEAAPVPLADPEAAADGHTLSWRLAALAPGDVAEVTYLMRVGAGARPGDHVNAATAVDPAGEALSNTARATVEVEDDLLDDRFTLIGRVAALACEPEDDWPRALRDAAPGVPGVRLWLETGDTVLTDEDGLYHFEGLEPGTHVVQVDEASLPRGYELVACEATTRHAGRAGSQFVDVRGGGLWRADFFLKPVGGEAREGEATIRVPEAQRYGDAWLEGRSGAPGFAYPDPARTPDQPSADLGIEHAPGQTVRLTLDGAPVGELNFEGTRTAVSGEAALSRWRGVDLREGPNLFVADILDASGASVATLSRTIHYVRAVERAVPVADRTELVADGRTVPVLGLRLEDADGRPVHAGRVVEVQVAPPYRLADGRDRGAELTAPLSASGTVQAGEDGIALVAFEPTLRTGEVEVLVTLDDGRQARVGGFMAPRARDWIVVGLAEGTVGWETLSGNATGSGGDGTFTDGRIAFFAKGLIKGEWLLTLAVDTDRSRGDRDEDFREEIDPNAYYTLYGDRTWQSVEAPSRYPLYVKLERRQFMALFGDFDTDLSPAELTRYDRRLTGLQVRQLGEDWRVSAFAAETNQGFARDEIAADGTSGPYRLSADRLLADSETVTLETRDRARPDRVLERRVLVRHIDYVLDGPRGELVLRLPVPPTDAGLNPNVLVVEYESERDVEREVTAGLRAEADFLGDRVTAGVTVVREGGDARAPGAEAWMGGVDVVLRPAEGWQARLEVARTRRDLADEVEAATAWLAEVEYRGTGWAATVYARSQEEGYGLGQTSSAVAGARRVGVAAVREFEPVVREDGTLVRHVLRADAYHEEDLETGDTRALGEVTASRSQGRWTATVGARHVRDEVDGEEADSTQALAAVQVAIPEWSAAVSLTHEQPVSGGTDAFPRTTTLAATKAINGWAAVTVAHEWRDGPDAEAHTTTAGLSLTPWRGGTVTLGADALTQDSARRLGATVGLDQQLRLSDRWSASVGLTHQTVVAGDGRLALAEDDVVPDAPVSDVETASDVTTGYLGVGYAGEATAASARLEGRRSDEDVAFIASAAAAREISETFSLAAAARVSRRDGDAMDGPEWRARVRVGSAWRPRDNGPVVLQRLDLTREAFAGGGELDKVVSNVALNARIRRRGQLSVHHGLKWTRFEDDGVSDSGFTHLLGAEARWDVTPRWDVGAHASVLHDGGSGTTQWSFGPSVGVSPVENAWLSLGYNFEGFDDADFVDADTRRHGLYLKLRLKFDERTARGLLDLISPATGG